MSEFTCPVVRVGKVGRHPNADTLSIWNGPQGPIVFRTGDFNDGDLACFVPIDSLVNVSRPQFSFLAQKAREGICRIRGLKLRGVPSVGLLLKCPDGSNVGDNLAGHFEVTKYEQPQTHSFGTDSVAVSGPSVPIYDVENYWNIDRCIVEGTETKAPEAVYEWSITEKVHGCNGKFLYHEGNYYVGSRTRWVEVDGQNVWATAFKKNQWLQQLCKKYEGIVFYGEVYGKVQDLRYGLDNDVDVLLFDSYQLKTGKFNSRLELALMAGDNKCCKQVANAFGSLELAVSLAKDYCALNPKSALDGKTMMQGVVIRPLLHEKMLTGPKYTRLITKVVSEQYLSRNNPTENH